MSDNDKRITDEELGAAAGGASYDGYFTYNVAYGDTLGSIASRFRTTATTLARLNNISSPYILRIGQTLLIPKG